VAVGVLAGDLIGTQPLDRVAVEAPVAEHPD
jgi:hypothetical protein